MAVGNLRNRGDVSDIPSGLPIDSMNTALVRSSSGLERSRIARIGKARADAELRQRVGKQIVGAAIQGRGRHDVIARFGDGLDRIGNGCLP
jgi:hypothetical protein